MFVDVSNFYFSLKTQGDLPFDAEEYASLVEELEKYFDIKEVRLYDSIKDRIKDPKGYKKQQKFHERLKKKISNLKIRHRKLRYAVNITKDKVSDKIEEIGLPKDLEDEIYQLLRELGAVNFTREKGLDVLLITDALEAHKSNKTECLIILSGDSDYVPAVKFMQGEGAEIINLHPYKGSSHELRNVCSEHILIQISSSGDIKLKRYSE